MKKIIIYSLIFFVALTSTAFFIANGDDEKNAKNISLFSSVFKILKTDFVDTLDSDILIRRAIDGMVRSVDPHTFFFDSLETRERENVWAGINYSGIGARVDYKDSAVIITSVIEGYGAQQNDLRAGDIYEEVDGVSLEGKSLDETLKLLRGTPETAVNITVNRPHVGSIQKTITRKQIVTKSIPFYTMLDSVTGYIQVQQFLRGSDIQFFEAVTHLKKNRRLRSIILDLRDNIGGLVEEAVNCVNVFVPKNTVILHVKGKATDYNNITHNEPLDTLMPLVILTNSNTISAGEIFTGAMQDLDRAVIIGQKTFGKGLVQGTRFPGQGTSLYLSAARYYTPSGRCIQKRDYSKRYINGKEKIFSDSLKKVFYTRNGRKVFDIGGIEPDIKTEPAQKTAPIIEALKKSSLIFDYATYFRNTREVNVPADKIIVTDVSFYTFVGYIENRKYPFKTPEELKLMEFEELSKSNNTIKLFEKKYKALNQQIIESKKEMLLQNKEQIKKALQEEIVSRYYYYTGFMENSLQTDPEVVYARNFLTDKDLYFQMLNKK
ncbi:MAG: S41 family peptidase [Bacteroidota bacterium]